ncbi:uncharacterized protein LOC135493659 [Lineus longissimus]|uniref:uncharacterized protein LOC135493659 n=1 Tax=Lineus longissimus TaxID=88925 RepID=UPI00315D26F1
MELPENLLAAWETWKKDLPGLRSVAIPRWYFTAETKGRIQLHHFCDASETGYGSVAYLRKIYDDGRIECAFLIAKSRTAPAKFVSVPRLELQAAVIAVRVDGLVRRELDLLVEDTYFWTDSKITLQYIRSEDRRFKTYVANRVGEIRDGSKIDQWQHIPGCMNPADLASRGQSVKSFLKASHWFRGPEFLWGSEENWPNVEVPPLPNEDPEIKEERIIGAIGVEEKPVVSKLLERYSNWTRLVRAVVILRKFCSYLRDKSSVERKIIADDMKEATLVIVKSVQKAEFQEDIESLENIGRVKTKSKLKCLSPVLIDGLLRVGGRIAGAPVSFDCAYPMILSKHHHVSNLLIEHFHLATKHAGQEHVLAKMRESFWIPQARFAVRRILKKCIGCRKRLAQRMTQRMANLPDMRLIAYDPPFTRTGVDYYGPMLVKRGRSTVKRWGVLFECMNVRAVHLEIAESMDTSSFVNALRRFIGRRGCPSDMWSDNGTNFVGGQRELREAMEQWNQGQIEAELSQKGIRWHFQPPGAPHMSGVWERLVRSTKRTLKAILGEGLVSDETLHTAHVEAEAILNSRPLCKASEDPKDEEALTPGHSIAEEGHSATAREIC